jgi:hypothetical protein
LCIKIQDLRAKRKRFISQEYRTQNTVDRREIKNHPDEIATASHRARISKIKITYKK